LSQTSNLTSITIKTEQLPVGIDTEFLLLDLREPDEYEQYHIKEAVNFPGPNIKRDKFIPQLLTYKNKENKIIVVYHFDEKAGIDYAKEMYEKGYDNIYLLSCGVEGFAQEIQDGLEGKNVPKF
jgi:centrosomal protein CEP41